MTEYVRCTPGQLGGLIQKKIAKLQANLKRALDQTVSASVPIIKRRAPKAFGDLQGSVHEVPNKVIVDAPHAGAVEIGSAPHKPDIEKLVAWVRLRGMQGLRNIRSSRLHGPTTKHQAQTVKALLSKEVQTGPGGKFSPVDAPRKVAEAIAKGIEAHGTRPHFFVRGSLPEIAKQLDQRVRRAIK